MDLKKVSFLLLAGHLTFASLALAITIGPMQTKKERALSGARSTQSNDRQGNYEQVLSTFLRGDYTQVEKRTRSLSLHSHANADRDRILYLRALSLMKLGRWEESREVLGPLETQSADPDTRPRAAYSLGDSYYYEGHTEQAKAFYRSALQKYPLFEEADLVRSRIGLGLAALPALPAQITRPLPQMSVESVPLYSVQVGSFSSEKNAKQLVSKLMRARYDAHILKDEQKEMFRVRVGNFASRHDALILERKLKKESYPTKIYP